ncbi:protodermal factor 1 [Punica granatum]|uniref:Protodermal factor 1 n=1 Tax=Punica granatum TaxID=22663 RepID=A0A218X1E4_PUNGR|nr:protodermal factor 1 [Punica granatum]OWM78763.1 hypothetical protein CDL15_Pgr002934 [Punica granatum]
MKVFVAICCLLALSSAVPALSASFEDGKNYYAPPDPNAGTPPPAPVYNGSPPHGGGSPPHHHRTPSPPANCGNPPPYHVPTPSRPSTPPSGGGGGSYTPPYSGGTPPTPISVTPPTPISVTPPTPIFGTPPTTPIGPGTPSTPTIPSPPFVFDPNNPFPGTCNFWRTHPTLIWGLVGWFGTVGNAFGVPSLPSFPSNNNLLQALSNTRTDGFGALYREGTAALLNSMASTRFPFTTTQVRNNFISALGSNKAAQSQARVFRLANEGHYKPRA